MAARKNVSTAVVRAWGQENIDLVPEVARKSFLGADGTGTKVRGRLHPKGIEAFHKANKGLRYETASEAEKPKVVVTIVGKDKRGRNTKRVETMTNAEARALLGHDKGRKGRFNMGALTEAVQQRYDAERAAPAQAV